MCKRAVILAGGKGTRLKPYTISLPKPLVPIRDKPIIEIIISQLKDNGFNHITISINYLADIIKAYIGNGSKWNIRIDYLLEEKPLSTIGPLSLLNDLPDNFLIMNGDVLTDLNFSSLFNSHVEAMNIFTISSFIREQKTDYGVLETDSHNYLKNFYEKPVSKYNVSMGVYVANKKILRYIPHNKFYGFDNLMVDLLKDNNPPYAIQHDGYWFDLGRPDDFEKAADNLTDIISMQ